MQPAPGRRTIPKPKQYLQEAANECLCEFEPFDGLLSRSEAGYGLWMIAERLQLEASWAEIDPKEVRQQLLRVQRAALELEDALRCSPYFDVTAIPRPSATASDAAYVHQKTEIFAVGKVWSQTLCLMSWLASREAPPPMKAGRPRDIESAAKRDFVIKCHLLRRACGREAGFTRRVLQNSTPPLVKTLLQAWRFATGVVVPETWFDSTINAAAKYLRDNRGSEDEIFNLFVDDCKGVPAEFFSDGVYCFSSQL